MSKKDDIYRKCELFVLFLDVHGIQKNDQSIRAAFLAGAMAADPALEAEIDKDNNFHQPNPTAN